MDNHFLEQRHTTYTPIKEKELYPVIRTLTGDEPISRNKIVLGYDNEVYSVQTLHQGEWIVRIRRFGEISFREELWALEACQRVGVPVPKTYGVQEIFTDVGGAVEVMVQEKLRGQPLAGVWKSLSPANRQHVLSQAMKVIRTMHSVSVNGFYRMHADGTWDFPTWDSIMDSSISARTSEKHIVLQNGFSEEDFEALISFMNIYKNEFRCLQPVLCHGDFSMGHIFIDENLMITGFIDFGEFQGGPPIQDIAYFVFQNQDITDYEILRTEYGFEAPSDLFEVHLHLHNLGTQIGFLAHETSIGDIDRAVFSAKRLKATLNRLKFLYS